MSIPKSLLNFLDKNKVKYEIIRHRTVYTAHDKAATLRLKPQIVAKSVVVKLDKKDHVLALLPANKNLDKKKFLKVINKALNISSGKREKEKTKSSPAAAKTEKKARYLHVDFVDEKWLKKNLKAVKVGATPPFGLFYNLPTFIDNALVKQTKLIVNAGDYQTSLKIAPSALFKLDKTLVKGSFSQSKK